MRPPPGCGPLPSNGMPRSKIAPRLTSWLAATTHSGVIRLTVPRSSSSPHRPQLRSVAPISRKSCMAFPSVEPWSGRRTGRQRLRVVSEYDTVVNFDGRCCRGRSETPAERHDLLTPASTASWMAGAAGWGSVATAPVRSDRSPGVVSDPWLAPNGRRVSRRHDPPHEPGGTDVRRSPRSPAVSPSPRVRSRCPTARSCSSRCSARA